MTSVSAYLGLFFSALLAATLFPAQSEAVLLALLHAELVSEIANEPDYAAALAALQ